MKKKSIHKSEQGSGGRWFTRIDFEAVQSGCSKLKVEETMTSNSSLNRHLFKAALSPGNS